MMICTLTPNPSVDYHMDLSKTGFVPGRINRSAKEELFPGGKGLNVSVILSELGIPSTAWGFSAGKVGALLEALAEERGVSCDLIRLPKGETRINVKLDGEIESAVNGSGPGIGPESLKKLLDRVRGLTASDTLILSGNLPSENGSLYEKICREAAAAGVRLIVDAEGDDLRTALRFGPFLVKPNEEELLSLYGSTDHSDDNLVRLLERCISDGAKSALVTLGERGALYLTPEGELYRAAVKGSRSIVSTVGAGDSTVAGLVAGLMRYPDSPGEVLRLACGAGTATAMCRWLASGKEIEEAVSFVESRKI